MRSAALGLVIVVCAGLGAAGWWLLRSHATDEAGRLRADLAQALERGNVSDLGRAQALGRRLVVLDARDREAAAGLAFTNAVLALDYGIDAGPEVAAALGDISPASEPADPVTALAAAARALVLARTGDRAGAARLAMGAAAAAPGVPAPLYALGRARALAGDLSGAARAFEAAIVVAPGFSAARVAWAETRLDVGDASTARTTLAAVVAASPQDLRARLLLDEAEAALGLDLAEPSRDPCPSSTSARWPPQALAAACLLARAGRARRIGARAEARAHAESAAALAVGEPRLLARIALGLAQLGAIDRATTLVERARRLAAPEMPALAWARAAVALGRGSARALPPGPRPADPETRFLIGRVALAAGGLGAVKAALVPLGDESPPRDLDLAVLAADGSEGGLPRGAAVAVPVVADDPVSAYVAGLRAQLAGDLPRAADRFAHALSGHGDACRAAGEFIATTRALKGRLDVAAFAPLRAENAGCVNLASVRP